MKIDSMDATFKSTVSGVPTQVKPEIAVKSEKHPDTARINNENNNGYTEEKVSDAFLESAINRANYTFEIQNRSLRFKIHERTNEIIVKVVDSETEEVIREIPPEKLLDMFANMLELAGLIVDERR
ncbi:MAG: flagellar protein FlaG [Acetivibrionales bacterium]|jgi:flagellar protein FlaG|nr:flagellar protein FlaG [Clostridiaceae bacterium]